MRTVELIRKKRDGEELTAAEVEHLVQGYVDGTVPDYQMAAWLMAVCWRGMTLRETADLTAALVHSGKVADLGDLGARAVDKHSTGGVGDKTTLVVAPLVAVTGVPVAKMSGRALGFTGGTLDKLEAIPGFRCGLSLEEFRGKLLRHGLAIAGQSADLAPADGKLYALRDVTGTVDCVPLIASSVMSKKIAAGAGAIVLDVKIGRGAFMKTLDDATSLARTMVEIGRAAGRRVTAVVSDMSQPLGRAVGNALEVREAIQALRCQGPADLTDLCRELAVRMLLAAGAAQTRQEASERVETAWRSGRGLAKLVELVEAQGGDPNVVDRPELLPTAPSVVDVPAAKGGYVRGIDAEQVGLAVAALGAGRRRKGDQVDPAVGVVLHAKVGDRVEAGQPLLTIHARSPDDAAVAAQVGGAFEIGAEAPVRPALVHAVLG